MALNAQQHQTIQDALTRSQIVQLDIGNTERQEQVLALSKDLENAYRLHLTLSPKQVSEIGTCIESRRESLVAKLANHPDSIYVLPRWSAGTPEPRDSLGDILNELNTLGNARLEFRLTYLYEHPSHLVGVNRVDELANISPELDREEVRLINDSLRGYIHSETEKQRIVLQRIETNRGRNLPANPEDIEAASQARNNANTARNAQSALRNGRPLTQSAMDAVENAVQLKLEHLEGDMRSSHIVEEWKPVRQMMDTISEAISHISTTQAVTTTASNTDTALTTNPVANALTEFITEQREYVNFSTGEEALERAEDASEAQETLSRIEHYRPLTESDLSIVSDAVNIKVADLEARLEPRLVERPLRPEEEQSIRDQISELTAAHADFQRQNVTQDPHLPPETIRDIVGVLGPVVHDQTPTQKATNLIEAIIHPYSALSTSTRSKGTAP